MPDFKKQRNSKIYKDHLKGLSLREMSIKYGVSHTRVRTIIKEWLTREDKQRA